MSENVRIERRGAVTGPKVAEAKVDALAPEARAALDVVLAEPAVGASPMPGGDRIWYRVTTTGPGGTRMRDVRELPAELRALPQFRF